MSNLYFLSLFYKCLELLKTSLGNPASPEERTKKEGLEIEALSPRTT